MNTCVIWGRHAQGDTRKMSRRSCSQPLKHFPERQSIWNGAMNLAKKEADHIASIPITASRVKKESPDHIDIEVAERFLEDQDKIRLHNASTIDDAAA